MSDFTIICLFFLFMIYYIRYIRSKLDHPDQPIQEYYFKGYIDDFINKYKK
jgi:hypothetical protein